jgi:hypothetical protein
MKIFLFLFFLCWFICLPALSIFAIRHTIRATQGVFSLFETRPVGGACSSAADKMKEEFENLY